MTKHPFTGGIIIPTACWLCGEELNADVHKEDRSIAAMFPRDRAKALEGFVDG